MLTQSACMRFLASSVVYLVDDRHLDRMYDHMTRRDNHMSTRTRMLYTRSRTCA